MPDDRSDSPAAVSRRAFDPRLAALLSLGALVIVLVVALVLASVSSSGAKANTKGNHGDVVSLTPKGAGGQITGEPLPQAALVGLDGSITDLRAVTAGRPTLVNFFSESCTACVTEMPALQRLAARSTGELQVVGIDVQDSLATTRSFLAKTGVRYRVLRDPQARILTGFGVSALPTTIAVSADGAIVGQSFGAFGKGELERWVAKYLGPS